MPENDVNLGGKLLAIESIFKWKPVIYKENINETICEREPQSDNEFNFFNFVLDLIESYMNYKQDDKDSAFKTINDLEQAVAKFTDDEGFRRIEDSYYHMVYASKIYLLSETSKKHEEVSVLLDKIKSIEDMNNCNKSSIHAMKSAAFALYSNEDTQKASASIEKALKLDPDNARWHFLKGLYKRKERRIVNPFRMPLIIEKDSFEKAFEKDPNNVVFKLSVADYYREISAHATKRKENCSNFLPKDDSFNENLRENVDSKIPLAAQYYKEAAEEYPDCPYVMFRCAEGLAKLPQTVSDVTLSRKLAKDGLKKDPDNVAGNFVMAFLCENIEKNNKEAQKHLKKCQEKTVFQAEMNMIRLLHATKREKFNGLEALQCLLEDEKYQEKARVAIIYSQMVSYHLLVEYDIVKACECAINCFKLNCTISCMQVHRSCFHSTREPMPLIDVLIDEVKLIKNDQKASDEIKHSCEKFIQYINFQNIPITKGFPQNLRQQILQGKTLNPDIKMQSPRKRGPHNNNTNRRNPNAGRGDAAKNRNPQGNNYRPQTSNKTDGGQNKSVQKSPKKLERLPSLMDTSIINPAPQIEEKVEEKRKPEPEKKPTASVEKPNEESEKSKNDSVDDPDDEELVLKVCKLIKAQKQAQRDRKSKDKTKSHKSHDSDENDDELVRKILEQLGVGDKKSTRKKKKHHSDSDDSSDSEYKRRKDRRRERSRRRYRSESDSDDSSDRHRRRHHHRRHRHHSSTDSDYASRSHRHKSHRKDRYERDTSPGDRRHRRNRSRSSDEDIGLKGKSLHYREGSISSEKRRREREDSVSSRSTRNRSPSYDKRRAGDRKESKAKSHAKSHHRDSSRDKYENRRVKKDTKSKKEHDSESLVRKDRDKNSPRKHYDQSDSD
ncbi:uncharacterized protein LOC135831714 [Planococcus citri]|uniref:uncharacterized protein LOC135831714 n=1 Tax=Planococcus citri TaxID=170843 RepID=UPI0031F86906